MIWRYLIYEELFPEHADHLPSYSLPTPGRSTICLIPNFPKIDAAPIPDRSSIRELPIAPAERTTRRFARTVCTVCSASGYTCLSNTYSTPTAWVPLRKFQPDLLKAISTTHSKITRFTRVPSNTDRFLLSEL